MRKTAIFLLLILCSAVSSAAPAGGREFKNVEKWVLQSYGKETLQEHVKLNLGGLSLGLLNLFEEARDFEEASPVDFEDLDHVGIAIYEFTRRGVHAFPKVLQRTFTKHGWHLALRSRSGDARIMIFLIMDGRDRASIVGLVHTEDKLMVLTLAGEVKNES